MRSLLISIVVLSVAFFKCDASSSFSSESAPASASSSRELPVANSNEYVHIDINKLGDAFMNYGFQIAPVINNSAYDAYHKISEFANTMSGVGPVLSLSSLYAEYIPSYAISKQLLDQKIAKLPSMINAENSQIISVLFTDNQWSTIGNALQSMSNYNLQAIQGIVDKINALQSLIYNPEFTFAGSQITAPDSDVQDFYNSFSTLTGAHQGLVQSFEDIIGLNQTLLESQQDSNLAKYLIRTIIHFYKVNAQYHNNVITQFQSVVTASQPSSDSSGTYAISTSTQVEDILNAANSLAEQFEKMGFAANSLANKIMSPPKSS